MGSILRALMQTPLLRPILRPLMRLLVGVIAIPLFRLFLKKVVRLQELDAELEKDLEQWFRGSLLLLAATANMEQALFSFLDPVLLEGGDAAWIMMGFRILLAVGVTEAMPDQELFAIVHPGPPKLKFSWKYGYFRELREKFWPICKGVLCQHLNRSSPVFAILAAIAPGMVGWICYTLAIVQYLIIGLVTSRDKAMDVLGAFDKQVAKRRREIIEEFDLADAKTDETDQPADTPAGQSTEQPADDPESPSEEKAADESLGPRAKGQEPRSECPQL